MKKFLKITGIIFVLAFAVIFFLSLNAGKKAKKIEYGISFSYPYARNLGLDWQQVYRDMLDELKPSVVRVPVYWNSVEAERGVYRFDEVDFQVDEAAKRNIGVVLGVGRRLPRWPECHDPDWLKGLSKDSGEYAQLAYVEAAVKRYSEKSNVTMWQVENEPFLGTFGECPALDEDFYDSELSLVKRLDPSRPILVTDSGELSMWFKAASRGDVFGTTLYRFVYSDIFNRYWSNFYIPRWFYRAKGGLIRIANPGKKIIIAELQAEPWTTKGITNTPIEEQFRTMGMSQFRYLTGFGKDLGYSSQYLWGVEWWYWMKTQNHPEFWEAAKLLINPVQK
jgi:hypothetical protein